MVHCTEHGGYQQFIKKMSETDQICHCSLKSGNRQTITLLLLYTSCQVEIFRQLSRRSVGAAPVLTLNLGLEFLTRNALLKGRIHKHRGNPGSGPPHF